MAVPRRPPLGVWLDGTRVAELTDRRPTHLRCEYTTGAVDRWPGNTPLLSCSLPLSRKPHNALAFFSGLLPEGEQRRALAEHAGVVSNDVFGLLERFGRDVAGALIIDREPPGARAPTVVDYPREQLEADIEELPQRPLGVHDDSELSLPGLQHKILLVAQREAWGRPVRGEPSTHILKVEDPRFPGVADAEAACLALAHASGIAAASATVDEVAGRRCIIVQRFDRRVDLTGGVTRQHQEDLCQALGIDAGADGRRKYERAQGPRLRDLADLLHRYAEDPDGSLERLVMAATFAVSIGNADMHGKNLSLTHPRPGVVELAPLYDTVPTACWPQLRAEMAMTVGTRAPIEEVTGKDVVVEAAGWSLSPATTRRVVAETAERVIAACEHVDDPEVPDAAESVLTGARRRAARLARTLR